MNKKILKAMILTSIITTGINATENNTSNCLLQNLNQNYVMPQQGPIVQQNPDIQNQLLQLAQTNQFMLQQSFGLQAMSMQALNQSQIFAAEDRKKVEELTNKINELNDQIKTQQEKINNNEIMTKNATTNTIMNMMPAQIDGFKITINATKDIVTPEQIKCYSANVKQLDHLVIKLEGDVSNPEEAAVPKLQIAKLVGDAELVFPFITVNCPDISPLSKRNLITLIGDLIKSKNIEELDLSETPLGLNDMNDVMSDVKGINKIIIKQRMEPVIYNTDFRSQARNLLNPLHEAQLSELERKEKQNQDIIDKINKINENLDGGEGEEKNLQEIKRLKYNILSLDTRKELEEKQYKEVTEQVKVLKTQKMKQEYEDQQIALPKSIKKVELRQIQLQYQSNLPTKSRIAELNNLINLEAQAIYKKTTGNSTINEVAITEKSETTRIIDLTK